MSDLDPMDNAAAPEATPAPAPDIVRQSSESSDAPAAEQAAPAGEPEIEDLLKEFDHWTADNGPPAPRYDLPAPTKDQETIALHNWAMQVETERQQAKHDRDTLAAIASVRGRHTAEEYPDAMIAGWLEDQARANPALQAAWEDRDRNPRSWSQALARLGVNFERIATTRPDPQATEDRALVTAAVRGTTKAPPPAETDASYRRRVERMSDAEFNRMRDEMIG
jgi:hypothetical protein